VLLPGSPAHSDCISTAQQSTKWPDAFQHPDYEDVPQLHEEVWNTHDVVICNQVTYNSRADSKLEKAKKAEFSAHPDRWYTEHLRDVLGHKVLSRSSVVLDATKKTIIALYTIGLPPIVTQDMHRVSGYLQKAYGKNVRNGQMTMVGQRSSHYDTAHGILYGAYYQTVTDNVNFNEQEERLTTNLLKGFCKNEMARSPLIASWRLRQARSMELGGCPFPGVPLNHVSCASFSSTLGYVKPLHSDENVESTLEAIFYDASRMQDVPAAHSWAFSLFEFGLIFDLRAAVSTALIIPSHLLHGTLGCDATPHLGMGMAILNKKNMLRGHLSDMQWEQYQTTIAICNRIKEGRKTAKGLGQKLFRNVSFKKDTFKM
jgi:hypothetical protein